MVEELKLRMELEPWKVRDRKRIVEHSLGTMKRTFNQGFLLLKGLGKVAGEVGFTILAYNMKRVLNILGSASLTSLVNG